MIRKAAGMEAPAVGAQEGLAAAAGNDDAPTAVLARLAEMDGTDPQRVSARNLGCPRIVLRRLAESPGGRWQRTSDAPRTCWSAWRSTITPVCG